LVMILYWFTVYYPFKGLAECKKHVRILMQWVTDIITLLVLP
jgi:hypothetical protein